MNIKQYVIESAEEFRTKMTWPTWSNLQQTTGVVLLASLLLSLIIFGMDGVANFTLKFVYSVK
jgi:preprotein translocase subunit SecE